jgi:hypothetical protein
MTLRDGLLLARGSGRGRAGFRVAGHRPDRRGDCLLSGGRLGSWLSSRCRAVRDDRRAGREHGPAGRRLRTLSSPSVTSGVSLARLAVLVREFHGLTARTPLAAGGEVVCHNDLSPKNTVYRDSGTGLAPVALIDWDIAAPGERIHDIAHVLAIP